ncbi:MAG: alanine racemase [Bacillota bacterium]|nr:alanine racemase [Bacillota bacterium]
MAQRTCAEIDLKAIQHNIIAVKRKAEGKEVMAVIKSDAYGHGAVPCAKALLGIVDSFAVATTEEAIELRESGLSIPILILGGIPDEEIDLCLQNDISMTVYSMKMADAVSIEAERLEKTGKIHVAIDTGMSRIGFSPTDESIDIIKKISKLNNLFLEGIFTHYAKADYADKSFVKIQDERFRYVCEKLSLDGINIKYIHIANSAVIMDFGDCYGNMVRAGIITYGLLPSDEVKKESLDIIPALTWKSRVAFVKEIEQGVGVSYGLTFVAPKKMKLATVSIGYGDGYSRLLSNKGRVLINGKSAKIVGRVCMDQIMVDVTGMDVKVDDVVTLIGRDRNEYISADEIADIIGTINYEVVCDIGKRVPRIYK